MTPGKRYLSDTTDLMNILTSGLYRFKPDGVPALSMGSGYVLLSIQAISNQHLFGKVKKTVFFNGVSPGILTTLKGRLLDRKSVV